MARELTVSASTLPNVTASIYEMDKSASKAARLAATFAIAHAILAGLSLYLIQSRTPGVDASSEEILAYFQDEQDRRMVLLTAFYLIPFAAISFIWFINAFRSLDPAQNRHHPIRRLQRAAVFVGWLCDPHAGHGSGIGSHSLLGRIHQRTL